MSTLRTEFEQTVNIARGHGDANNIYIYAHTRVVHAVYYPRRLVPDKFEDNFSTGNGGRGETHNDIDRESLIFKRREPVMTALPFKTKFRKFSPLTVDYVVHGNGSIMRIIKVT